MAMVKKQLAMGRHRRPKFRMARSASLSTTTAASRASPCRARGCPGRIDRRPVGAKPVDGLGPIGYHASGLARELPA